MKQQYQIGLILGLILLIALPGWAQVTDAVREALDQGNCSKAGELFEQEVKKAAPFMQPILYIGFALGLSSRDQCYDLGIEFTTKVIKLSPEQRAVAYGMRGGFWESKGQCDNAIADYTKSIELKPSYVNGLYGMAWLLATCPETQYRDGKRSLDYAEKLMEVAKKEDKYSGYYFKALAAAHAEIGNFPEAIDAQEQAIALLKEHEREALKFKKMLFEYEAQLASYKAQKPWRIRQQKTEKPEKITPETETVPKKLSKEDILKLQERLTELGYNPGPIDGAWGRKTETALKKFQQDNGLSVTGKLDEETKEKLGKRNAF